MPASIFRFPMLSIARATFQDFRGLSRAELLLDRQSVLIGGNNCGKTALIEGLALALGRDSTIPRINDYDFFEGFFAVEDPLTRQFHIRVVLTGFTPNEVSAHPEWFNLKNGTPPRWWDSSTNELRDTPDGPGTTVLPLAVEVACTGLYDEDSGEYKVLRYFSGANTPQTLEDEGVTAVPTSLLRRVGVFLLPSRRVWDGALTFGASSFARILREQHAVPERSLRDLRRSLAASTRPEGDDAAPSDFGALVGAVQRRLASFGLLNVPGERLRYRPTNLDARGLLESLVPHVEHDERYWTPLAAQGDGVIALQNLLLLMEIGSRRRAAGEGFILLMEEPELHVHPGLQRQIVSIARQASNQLVVSTHSPFVASAFPATSVHIIKRTASDVRSERLLPRTLEPARKNLLKRYTYQERLDFLEAVMGSTVLVPEGEVDADWLRWLMAVAAARADTRHEIAPPALSTLRTKAGQLRASVEELRRLNASIVAVTDGDPSGVAHAAEAVAAGAGVVLRWPDGFEIEHIIAAILESAVAALREAVPQCSGVLGRTALVDLLLRHKNDALLREHMMEVAFDVPECQEHAAQLMEDLVALSAGGAPSHFNWRTDGAIRVLDAL